MYSQYAVAGRVIAAILRAQRRDSEREPTGEEGEPAERRDRAEPARSAERQAVEGAAEQQDPGEEQPTGEVPERSSLAREAEDDQRERVQRVVVDRGRPRR